MIRHVKIENYKSLESVSIHLKDLTIIFGPNAAGKSNLFDALNLVSRVVTHKNIKEAFENHRGLPLESIHYNSGSLADLLRQETHRISFEIDVELSDRVIRETEQRIRDLRKGIEEPNDKSQEKSRITHRLLRYNLELEIHSRSGVIRVMNERLAALRLRGNGEKARNPFIEKVGNKLSLRMEGQSHPTMHELGLDYAIASTSLYAPHYPHLTAFREEMSRCRFYYFEPRILMREANAISEGTLRVLGLLAVLSPHSGTTSIGYEEPENGVHPRRLRKIAELLINAASGSRQILVNTHSPVLPTYRPISRMRTFSYVGVEEAPRNLCRSCRSVNCFARVR